MTLDFFLIIAIIFTIIALILGFLLDDPESHSNLTGFGEITAIESQKFSYVLMVEMTISGQMLLDIIIDNLTVRKNMFSMKGSKINVGLLLSLFISSIINFCYIVPNTKYILLVTFHQIRLVFMGCVTCSMAQSCDKIAWDSKLLMTSIFIFCVGAILKIISASAGSQPEGAYESLKLAHLISVCIGVPNILFFCIKWFYKFYMASKERKLTLNEIHCAVYATNFLVCAVALFLSLLIFAPDGIGLNIRSPLSEDDSFFIIFEIVFMVFVVIIGMHQVRTLRKQATQYK
eukprot:gene12788-26964_t